MNKPQWTTPTISQTTIDSRYEMDKQLNKRTHDYFSKEELESIRAEFEIYWSEERKFFNGAFWNPEEGRYTVLSEKQSAWMTWKAAIISVRNKDRE